MTFAADYTRSVASNAVCLERPLRFVSGEALTWPYHRTVTSTGELHCRP